MGNKWIKKIEKWYFFETDSLDGGFCSVDRMGKNTRKFKKIFRGLILGIELQTCLCVTTKHSIYWNGITTTTQLTFRRSPKMSLVSVISAPGTK
jgi:hypothetical protein